ncbi:MAG: hypothetical protein N2316_07410 [Spirochaetes bacterium]|nr:hypothetical protein [Spirochaetota bacterium]
MKLLKIYFTKYLHSLTNKKNFILIALIISFFLVLAVVALIISHTSKKPTPIEERFFPSTFNTGSSGTMAFREFLHSVGIDTTTYMRSFEQFSFQKNNEKSAGLILFIEPQIPLQKKEILNFATLCKQGTNIVVFTSCEEKIAGIMRTLSEEYFPKIKPGMYLTQVNRSRTSIHLSHILNVRKSYILELPGKKRFYTFPREWEILAFDREGVFLIRKSYGKGSLILVSDSEFISNRFLRKEQNGLFAFRLIEYCAQGKTVIFDEFHHGFRRRFTLFYFIAQTRYLIFILHLVLFFIALAFASFIRFGQIHISQEKKYEKIFFFSKGMASLLAKKRFATNLAQMLVHILHYSSSFGKRKRMYSKKIQLLHMIEAKIQANNVSFKDLENAILKIREGNDGN